MVDRALSKLQCIVFMFDNATKEKDTQISKSAFSLISSPNDGLESSY